MATRFQRPDPVHHAGAANRDPDVFSQVDIYNVGRSDNVHVASGYRIHFCLGASLSRLETRIAFEELLQMVPQCRLLTADGDLDHPVAGMLRSPRQLVLQATT